MYTEGTTSVQTSTTNLINDNSVLGKDDFLKLYMEQLKNQDPLQPMDNSELTSQMAQFSMVEQLSNLDTSATELLSNQDVLMDILISMNNYNSNSMLANYSNLIGLTGHWIDQEGLEQSGKITSLISKDQQIFAVIDGNEIMINSLNKLEEGI